jgi:hypothetical protein
MESQTLGLRVAAVFFGLVALVQLARLMMGVEVAVNGHAVPRWPSAVALVIAAALSFWLAWLSYRGTK